MSKHQNVRQLGLSSALSQRPAVYQRLAEALRSLANDRGLPYGVSPQELAQLTTNERDVTGARLLISRILTSEGINLNRELAKVGLSFTAYADGPDGTGRLAYIDAGPCSKSSD